jgi:UDP-N-acetylglucosamine--N-acetylmuramyl-(pentapeptide) pyrophosphoryl-undecaprenol N-acetylglucosamine transferase
MKNKKPKKILLTGGGTAGHVLPNLALVPLLKKQGYVIEYMGSYTGIEKDLVTQHSGISKYHGISSGKLRRYFSWQNVGDVFRVGLGIVQAIWKVGRIRPNIIFSKGGFVTVPVVFAGWIHRVPVVLHESDITPGLANKLSTPFAKKVCTSFEETGQHLPPHKWVYTGSPIREDVLTGSAERGRAFCGWDSPDFLEIPILLVMGGSLGAEAINQALQKNLSELLQHFCIVHLSGKGKQVETSHVSLESLTRFRSFEYLDSEMSHVLATSDLVLSRAGAGAISELLALQKPHLLVPLSAKSSRGDQILNAQSFSRKGYSIVIEEEKLEETSLTQTLQKLWDAREQYQESMAKSPTQNATQKIIDVFSGIL